MVKIMRHNKSSKGEPIFLAFSVFFLSIDVIEVYLHFSVYLIWLFTGLYLLFTTISLFRFNNRPFGMLFYALADLLVIVATFNPFVQSVFITAAMTALLFQALAVRGKFDLH